MIEVNNKITVVTRDTATTWKIQGELYTGCIKKKVIELQRAVIRELLGV